MAIWYAQNAGAVDFSHVSGGTTSDVWNSAANGSGSWLDLSSDYSADVFAANGKLNITIDINVTCARLSSKVETGSTNGGTFLVDEARVITADIVAGSSNVITTTGSGYKLAVFGDLTGGINGRAVYINNTCDFEVTTTTAGAGITNTNGSAAPGLYIDSSASGTFAVNGDVLANITAGQNGARYALYSAKDITINGNIIASASLAPAIFSNSSGAIVTCNGLIINTLTSQAIVQFGVIYNPSSTAKYIQYPKTTDGAGTYKYAKEPAATDIKKDVVVGTVTGTYEGTGGSGGGPLIGLGGLVS